jgi:hypothetical protein
VPVSPTPGSARRSGDPRRRAAAETTPDTATRRWVAVAAVVVLGVGVVALAALRPAGQPQEDPGRDHAEVACDLTSRAEEATAVASDARLAAAVLLLDQAIIASARAADGDAAFSGLDDAVQAVHTAGHSRDPDAWRASLDTALAECRSVG